MTCHRICGRTRRCLTIISLITAWEKSMLVMFVKPWSYLPPTAHLNDQELLPPPLYMLRRHLPLLACRASPLLRLSGFLPSVLHFPPRLSCFPVLHLFPLPSPSCLCGSHTRSEGSHLCLRQADHQARGLQLCRQVAVATARDQDGAPSGWQEREQKLLHILPTSIPLERLLIARLEESIPEP